MIQNKFSIRSKAHMARRQQLPRGPDQGLLFPLSGSQFFLFPSIGRN